MNRVNDSVAFRRLRWILVILLIALPGTLSAEEQDLDGLRALNGVQMSGDELRQLLPNAKVVSHFKKSTRRWRNEPSGKFTASADAREKFAMGKPGTTGRGEWRIGDDGTYCVKLEWPQRSENWCWYIFKVDSKYYGVNSVTNGGAKAFEFEFSK